MTTTIGQYTVRSTVSENPTQSVLRATPPDRLHLGTGPVLVKVIHGAVSSERYPRLLAELRRYAEFDSPYLVTLLDAGTDGDRVYYAVEAPPLGTLAEPARVLTHAEILRAVAHAARGAHALHEAGIAHRSISPASITVHENGGRLADLEFSRFIEPGVTVTSQASAEVVEFVDPGVIRGERASRASDIWSLGATLHRALTGTCIYGQDFPVDLMGAVRRVLSEGTAIDFTLPAEAAGVVRACLEPLAADRPPTALVLAEQIEAL